MTGHKIQLAKIELAISQWVNRVVRAYLDAEGGHG